MQLQSKVNASICMLVLILSQCVAFGLQSQLAYQGTTRAHEMQMSTAAAVAAPIPELRAPKDLFANVVNIGAAKAKLAPLKTLMLGVKSGCHISFGKICKISKSCPSRFSFLVVHSYDRCFAHALRGWPLPWTSGIKQSRVVEDRFRMLWSASR